MTVETATRARPTGFSPLQYAICLKGIVWREGLRFLHQRERFVAALVRPAGLAVHFRHRLSASARRVHHSTLRNLCAVRGLHHARTDIADPALQRDAVLALDGLRSRDGQHAHPAREPAAAVVPALVEACRRHDRVAAASLHISRDCLVLGNRGPGHRLYRGVAGPGACRASCWAHSGCSCHRSASNSRTLPAR